ncbi:MAG: CBS domain-containing protein [Planctomycetes bacterium]|nr:CBS domain-containing protein [Planctomycetota bacterium]
MSSGDFNDAMRERERIEGTILQSSIRDLDLRTPVFVRVDTAVHEAVQAMRDHHIGCLLVQEAGRLAGIITERDILNRVVFLNESRSLRVGDVMTRNPETLSIDDSVAFALNKMSVGGYRHVPIINYRGEAIGVVSVRDIVALLVELFPAKVLNLPCDPARAIARDTDGG